MFKTVIDGIVLVLNAFAIIALLAASFGIVNTLFMSVQERTREIGLMKAMGMGNGRVFSLFSLEAAFIGFLGSAIGVVIAMLAGSALSSALSGSLLADLPGLTLIAFDPVSIVGIILVVMADRVPRRNAARRARRPRRSRRLAPVRVAARTHSGRALSSLEVQWAGRWSMSVACRCRVHREAERSDQTRLLYQYCEDFPDPGASPLPLG